MSVRGYHGPSEVVQDAIELAAHIATEDVSGTVQKVVEIAEKVMDQTVAAQEQCMRNPNWDPDPGC